MSITKYIKHPHYDLVFSAEEQWKECREYEGLYAVSTHGRVKSLERKVRHRWGFRRVAPRILRPGVLDNGYLLVNLSKHNKAQTVLVHRLVLQAFIGPCPDGMECCHEDGDKTNNHLQNLRWATPKENSNDDIRNGTKSSRIGDNHYKAKVTESDVKRIRHMFYSGECTQKELSLIFKVGIVCIHKIVYKKTWRHI